MVVYTSLGAVFKRAGVAVAQVVNIDPPEKSQGVLRSRPHDATNGWSTAIGSGARDLGPMTITIEFDPAQATHDSLEGDIDSESTVSYAIILKSGDTWTMDAIAKSMKQSELPSEDPAKETRDFTFETSGPIVVT